ncbi:hypothetical protein LINPERPRIM_LOCUS3972 [Linum perenne]
MARYVPPNKRHSVENGRSCPTPEAFAPHFRRTLNFGRDSGRVHKAGKIIYANSAMSRWFAVGLDDHHQFPPHIGLEPISVESIQRGEGEQRLILVNKHPSEESDELVAKKHLRNPWEVIAADVLKDLLSSFQILKTEIEAQRLKVIKPTLVARFGKILFREGPSQNLGALGNDQLANALMNSKRSFYTNLPSSYVDSIMDQVVPSIGLDFEEQKDLYHVKVIVLLLLVTLLTPFTFLSMIPLVADFFSLHVQLSDSRQPDATLSCKCTLGKDKKLQLHKACSSMLQKICSCIL